MSGLATGRASLCPAPGAVPLCLALAGAESAAVATGATDAAHAAWSVFPSALGRADVAASASVAAGAAGTPGTAVRASTAAVVLAVALMALLFPAPASAVGTQPPQTLPPLVSGDELIVVTHHSLRTPGGSLEYEARAGRLPIRVDETGEVHAYVFFVAYVVTNRGARRPLTFAWNGGPTVPSIYLHTEFLGPRRLERSGFVDNPATALAATDLVLYDPVETGFSRPAKPEFAAEFLNMKGDIAATSEFIRAYRERFGAETQPLFILGESYGAWRAAGVSEFLANRNMGIAGVMLISGGFAGTKPSLAFSHAMDIQARAAGAFYYRRLPPELMRDRAETLRIVDQWAVSAYLPALEHVAELSSADRASIARQLAKFTGFPPEQIDPNTLVVNTSDYLAGFFAPDKARTLSELDLRITGEEPVEPTRSLQISHYLRTELGYNTDLSYSGELNYPGDVFYRALESGYVPTPGPARRRTGAQWSYNQSEEAPAALEQLRATGDAAYLEAVNPPWIENAMTAEPNLRVFVALGRFDPTNSCEGVARIIAGLGSGMAGRVQSRCYEGGHMMYRDEGERIRLSDDLARFITAAAAVGPERHP